MIKEVLSDLKDRDFLNYVYSKDTPAIIYNMRLLKNWLKNISEKCKKYDIKLLYSIKANFNKEILNVIKENVEGVDCASYYEYKLCRELGFSKISCVGAGFTQSEIIEILNNNCIFDADSIEQLQFIDSCLNLNNYGIRFRCNEYLLGITINELRELSKNKSILDKINRLHFHGGNLDFIINYLNEIKDIINLNNIEVLNLGGGDLCYDLLLSTDVTESELTSKLNCIRKLLPKSNIYIEPGQIIVANCGVLTSKVLWKKEDVIILDTSSFNISSWYKPYLICPKYKKGNTSIIGNTNTSDDVFIKDMHIDESINKVLFAFTGAYYKTTHRNLHNYEFPNEFYYW